MFPTREKAKEAIMSGIIHKNGKLCTKAGERVVETDNIEIVGQSLQYVSRAGLKLEKAQKIWNIDFNNKVVLDVGASTGGFTDFAIKNGAKKVYSVDVGKGQLHESLKNNNKVVNMEKTDFRTMKPLKDKIDIAVCDCSFISLKLLCPKFIEVLTPNSILITLIKPQFECGKEIAKKNKGVLKDKSLQNSLKTEVINFYTQNGFNLCGEATSPILGTQGNVEFLAYFTLQK